MTKTKILAITSDPSLLRLLQQEFSEGHYEIANIEHTGNGLREVLYQVLPDFIILDIMMPTLDGIEICLHLRQWTQVPIVMLSTWGATEGKVRGLNLGSNSYLTEPFGADELKARINKVLRRNSVATINPMTNFSSGIP